EQVEAWQRQGYEVWVGAEGFGGYLSPLDVHLCASGCKYVNIPPLQFKLFREAMRLQPDKSDEKDSRLLAEVLHWQVENGQARVCEQRDDYFKTLKETSRALKSMTESKVCAQNQLASMVREYWPELVITGDYFSTTDAVGLLALLSKYPTPQAVTRAGKARVRKVLSTATGHDERDLAERLVNDACLLRKIASVSPLKATVV
ncbi:MAG: transposase, partial [Candidatus Latescibacteria bacterium]|nr:transposase [Candidatus Latescibacterota bacterium]NIO78549.1 transposase [Candidatus Latescibacterota bacterium]